MDLKEMMNTLQSSLSEKLLPALVILLLGIWITRIIMNLVCRTLEKSKLERAAHSLVKTLTRVVLYALLGFMIADKLGIDVTGVIAISSVVTLAVSLATQNALSNIVGGFTLLSTHPFASGDYVEIAGQSGTVKEIGIAYTKLATPDNKIISLPNSAVMAAEIVNYSTTGTRRVDISITASYDAPPEKVKQALLEAARIDTVLSDPAPFTGLKNFGDSSIEYILQVWTESANYWSTYFTINENISRIFKENGIEMTYPHLNVHLDK